MIMSGRNVNVTVLGPFLPWASLAYPVAVLAEAPVQVVAVTTIQVERNVERVLLNVAIDDPLM